MEKTKKMKKTEYQEPTRVLRAAWVVQAVKAAAAAAVVCGEPCRLRRDER